MLPLSVYKLNVDETLFFDTHKASIDFLVRNHAGNMALPACIFEKNVDNLVVIEVLAIIRSLQLCMHHGFTNIIIESNCLLLVEEILAPAAPCSALDNIISDISNLMHYFISCSIQYTSRDRNRAAHCLARYARHMDR